MAVVSSNAFTTYDAKGNREDLSDSIYNIDPFDTPVVSMAGRRTVKNRLFDWQTENLPTVKRNNADEEGFSLTRGAAQPTVRQQNTTQISHRDATVTGSQEASDAAGKSSEMAHQMAMQSKALKSDIEAIAVSRQARADGAAGVARTTESIPHQIARTPDKNSVANAAVYPNTANARTGTPTASGGAWTPIVVGNIVSFSETIVGDAMEGAYNNGAEPTKLIVPPGIKRTISTFTGRSSSQVLVGKTEVVSVVDIIATDFGRITVLPSRWFDPTGSNIAPAGTIPDYALQLDPEYLAIAFFRTFRQYPIAKTGDVETRMILAEWGCEVRNGLAHIVYNGVKK